MKRESLTNLVNLNKPDTKGELSLSFTEDPAEHGAQDIRDDAFGLLRW